MKVLKFGGTSLKDSQRFLDCAKIISVSGSEVAVVLSAPASVTNRLHGLIDAACKNKQWQNDFDELQEFFKELLESLNSSITEPDLRQTNDFLQQNSDHLKKLLEGTVLISQCPDDIFAQITSIGEKISVNIMAALMRKNYQHIEILDPQKTLIAEGDALEAVINIEISQQAFTTKTEKNTLYLMPGFLASNKKGKAVLLGRNGSDYSATALAVLFKAEQCEIWTDVDGVYNCDPRLVADANLLHTLSYQEAMELSYFGAKVLHPKTITPISQFHIPLLIKNTGDPKANGTLISNTSVIRQEKVKAISHLEHMSLINVSGSGLKGMAGMAGRLFSSLSRSGISITLITQSSSEYGISLCIHTKDSELANEILQLEFQLEMEKQLLEPLEILHQVAVVSLIGDGMLQAKGVSARFLTALADVSINIIAIAQGSSERSISVVINSVEAESAVKACHQQFFNSNRYIDLFVLGCGGVGSELLNQIHRQSDILAKKEIVVRVCGVANSKKIVVNAEGIDLDNWHQHLALSEQEYSLELLKKHVIENQLINPVIVDCSSSQSLSDQYVDLFNAGFHVVTANKKANSNNFNYYKTLRKSALANRRKFFYDTNVGAGLPIIENLQNLLLAGDKLHRFNGILSGSLSYIFGELEKGIPFSKVTINAKQKGFTEPDPRDDLSGIDVARKLLILARETGLEIELEDINIESVLPVNLSIEGDTDSFMQKLPEVDLYFKNKVNNAKQKGEVLRYVGSIENGKCSVSIQSIGSDNPLFKIKDGENALAFYSKYYQPIPLVLRGYGAGAEVTAAGIYSDILKTVI